jgi:Tfp pilus assembly protein PilV
MVEMLMAAFILSLGLLGLTMLQVLSLRSAGSSRNLGSAVLVAENLLDRVEMEGRLTYLNQTYTSLAAPAAIDDTKLTFIHKTPVERYYSVDPVTGTLVEAAAHAPFHATVTQTVSTNVGLTDVTVTVVYTESINPVTKAPIQKTVSLTRRILHA